jgi:hypothetical protein
MAFLNVTLGVLYENDIDINELFIQRFKVKTKPNLILILRHEMTILDLCNS